MVSDRVSIVSAGTPADEGAADGEGTEGGMSPMSPVRDVGGECFSLHAANYFCILFHPALPVGCKLLAKLKSFLHTGQRRCLGAAAREVMMTPQ